MRPLGAAAPTHPGYGTLGGLGVTYANHLELVRKLVVDFLQVVIAHLSLALTLSTNFTNTSKSPFVEGGGAFWG